MTGATLTERSRPGIDCAALLVLGFVALAILRPLQNAPFIDDATYAWSVEWLLQRGELRILDWAGSLNLTQVLWGWLFCLPGGFSFSALRLSTFVLGQSGVCALYLLLRELDVERRHALLGAGVLALNPVFFILQFTFMTDVAFVVLMVWSCFAAVRALRRKSDAWLWARWFFPRWQWAHAWSLLRFRWPFRSRCSCTPAMGALWRTLPGSAALASGARGAGLVEGNFDVQDGGRFSGLSIARLANGKFTPWRLTAASNAAGSDGVYCNVARHCAAADQPRGFSPELVVANHRDLFRALSGPRRKPASRRQRLPVRFGLDLESTRIGRYRAVPRRSEFSGDAGLVVFDGDSAVAGFGGALFCQPVLQTRSARGRAADLDVYRAVHALRDSLAFRRSVRAADAATCHRAGFAWRSAARFLALALLGLFGGFCLVGTRDHLAYNAAVWAAVERLREQGVAASEIDGGYVVNSWLQYAYPENAPRDHGRAYVPKLTNAGVTLRYELSNEALPGQKLIATEPYRRWLAPSGKIYVRENPVDSADPLR